MNLCNFLISFSRYKLNIRMLIPFIFRKNLNYHHNCLICYSLFAPACIWEKFIHIVRVIIMHNTVQKYTYKAQEMERRVTFRNKPDTKVFFGFEINGFYFHFIFFNTFVGKNSLVILNQGNIQFYNKNWPLYDSHSIMKLVIHTICFHLKCF